MDIFIPLSPRLFDTKVCKFIKIAEGGEGQRALLPNDLNLGVLRFMLLYLKKQKIDIFFLLVKIF